MALEEICEKCKKLDPKIWIASYVLISAFLLYWYPPVQVSHFEINNATIDATLENQYRSTLAQILGGGAVTIGIYFAWNNFKIAQENLKVSQEGQITERFTRAIDQLGDPNLEIRLGGIYTLERISKESKKDYCSIMEIFTAYIRQNSPYTKEDQKTEAFKNIHNVPMDIQKLLDIRKENMVRTDIKAIISIIRTRKYFFPNNPEQNPLDLQRTYLREVNLIESHLEWADFTGAFLEQAFLNKAHLTNAFLVGAILRYAILKEAILIKANLTGADFEEVNLEGANLEEADLRKASHLSLEQLSKVKTLYNAKLDEKLEIPSREKYPALFEKPKR